MGFVAMHIAGSLLRVGPALVVCATLGLLLSQRRIGRILLGVGVLCLFAILVLPVQNWTLRPLENRFAQPLPPPHVDGIVVLGGAVDVFVSADRGIPSLNGAAERMTEAVILARRYPQAQIVFTGGIGAVLPGAIAEAEVARTLFVDLGLPPDRVTYEGASRTTYENAVFTQREVRPAPGSTWLLLTSAGHMPRAVGVFRRIGWNVIAWPVGYKTVAAALPALAAPLSDKLGELDAAAHEWAGLLVYRLTGRTDAIFPAP